MPVQDKDWWHARTKDCTVCCALVPQQPQPQQQTLLRHRGLSCACVHSCDGDAFCYGGIQYSFYDTLITAHTAEEHPSRESAVASLHSQSAAEENTDAVHRTEEVLIVQEKNTTVGMKTQSMHRKIM